MKKAPLIFALVALAACRRPHADQPTPGADGETQAATANKTIADLQAADEAAQGPAPYIAPVAHHEDKPAKKVAEPVAPAAEEVAPVVTEGNSQ